VVTAFHPVVEVTNLKAELNVGEHLKYWVESGTTLPDIWTFFLSKSWSS
jgi:hypothetical protein